MPEQRDDVQIDRCIGWTEALGQWADNPPCPRSTGELIYSILCPKCDLHLDPHAQWNEKSPHAGKYLGRLCPQCNQPRVVKAYRMSTLEQGIKAQFEQWVRDGAQLAIADDMAANLLEEAERKRETYMASRHDYVWKGKHVERARNTMVGIHYMCYLLLRRCHPDMTEELAAKIVDGNPRGYAISWAWAQGNLPSPAAADGKATGVTSNGQAAKSEPQPVTMDG